MKYKITTESWDDQIMAKAESDKRVLCGFGETAKEAIAEIIPRLMKSIEEDIAVIAELSAQFGGANDE